MVILVFLFFALFEVRKSPNVRICSFFSKAHFLVVILSLLDALYLRHKYVILFSTGVVYLNVTL